MAIPDVLTIAALQAGYRAGAFTPEQLLNAVYDRIEAAPERHAWIRRLARGQVMAHVRALEGESPSTLPLYGVPFAIKDNIDLAGIPTTAGCPDYAYVPTESATVVQRLVAAGAIPVGKTNLDQFATGLVGTRSPYGACRNSIDPAYISGGSSSGSAVTVASGLVSFALGTDTAGSGRIPAAFNNLIGVKPTCGWLSTTGVVPACRSLDSVSIFTLTAADAAVVLEVARGVDAADPYSRHDQARKGPDYSVAPLSFRFGVPLATQLEFFGDGEYARLFDTAVAALEAMGGVKVPLDFSPFLDTAKLLYEGPWVAERYAAIEGFLRAKPDSVFPVTRQVIAQGQAPTAVDAFRAQYRLKALAAQATPAWDRVDIIVTPTAGTIYRIAELLEDPVRLNSNLGRYTNFLNLLDLAAVAVPAGFRTDGLPFGITLVGTARSDHSLLALASRFHAGQAAPVGARLPLLSSAVGEVPFPPSNRIDVAVCGAHLSGLPLNGQLTDRGAVLVERTHTAATYKLYALPGGPPFRPGMVKVAEGGEAIEVEVWSVPADQFGSFVAGIPSPLGIGKVSLADGRQVSGFVCESLGVQGAKDITALRGWRAYLASL
jgi:allophanate hydrolase